jgi:HSP20 family molecular chaperone IbpA
MARPSLSANPLLLGFDQIERLLDRINQQGGDSYPPFNIEQIGDNGFRISVAVAGFAPDELNVELENQQLVIRGRQAEQGERVFLHRGIAARQFRRAFVLESGLEVTTAGLTNGILSIELRRPETVSATRKIAIETR